MNTSNITDFTVFDEYIFHFNAIKVLHGIGFVVCLIAGCIFYGGIVAYERFGGDPAKRSLHNKLIASVFSLPIIFQPFVFGFAWRIIIGPLNIQGWFLHFNESFENNFKGCNFLTTLFSSEVSPLQM